MTTPNQQTPADALGTGEFAAWQAMTEEDAKAQMRAPLSSFQTAQDNEHAKWGGFLGIANFLSGLTNAFTGSSNGGGFFSGIFNHAQAQQQAQVVLENKVEDLISGGTRFSYMSSTIWSNPGPGKLICVACVNGGAGGPLSSATVGAKGGNYVYAEFKSEDLPSTVAITVGSGGAGATSGNTTPAAGLPSSFGTFVVASPTSDSGILTAQGILATAGAAGSGGLGQNSNGPGTSGGGNALAAGGVYTGSDTGSAGQAAPTDRVAVAGGGGGAGGGSVGAGLTSRGGAGGWPGGGGGASGSVGFAGSANGGAGAYGAVFVTVKG